jgi:hypothetical protein
MLIWRRRRINFLTSSKPPSLGYGVPWGLLDPPLSIIEVAVMMTVQSNLEAHC